MSLAGRCPGPSTEKSPKATLALETSFQGGAPRTGITQATRAYIDESRSSTEEVVWGGIGANGGWISGGEDRGNAVRASRAAGM